MTQTPEALRQIAEAVKDWGNIDDFWPQSIDPGDDDFGIMVVGHYDDEEREPHPLFEIDAYIYGDSGESKKLAEFYAAANPAAVVGLIDSIARLEAELVKEAARTAAEKLRADQMTQRLDMANRLGNDARAELAQLRQAGATAGNHIPDAGRMVPLTPVVDPTTGINAIIHFKRGWKAAEAAHGIGASNE